MNSMIYAPDSSKDNAELVATAMHFWNCREHQMMLNDFHRWEQADREIQDWRGHQIDILIDTYFEMQNLQIKWSLEGAGLEGFEWSLHSSWYDKRWHRAVATFGYLAEQGALSTEQCRAFDRILQTQHPQPRAISRGA